MLANDILIDECANGLGIRFLYGFGFYPFGE
jgi:hypothetical protein